MVPERGGFTLIELLVVVVVVGVLASIAAGRYWEVRRKAYRAAVENDLRILSIHQELYFHRYGTYGDLSSLTDFETSQGVSVQVTAAAATGWAATAAHVARSALRCGIFVGGAPAAAASPATRVGAIACTE